MFVYCTYNVNFYAFVSTFYANMHLGLDDGKICEDELQVDSSTVLEIITCICFIKKLTMMPNNHKNKLWGNGLQLNIRKLSLWD